MRSCVYYSGHIPISLPYCDNIGQTFMRGVALFHMCEKWDNLTGEI